MTPFSFLADPFVLFRAFNRVENGQFILCNVNPEHHGSCSIVSWVNNVGGLDRIIIDELVGTPIFRTFAEKRRVFQGLSKRASGAASL
jgi:hypothetical protein